MPNPLAWALDQLQRLAQRLPQLLQHAAGQPVQAALLLANVLVLHMASRKLRRARFTATVQSLRELDREGLEFLLRRQLPMWVKFGDWERGEHLQSFVSLAWPTFNRLICGIIKREVEDRLGSHGLKLGSFREVMDSDEDFDEGFLDAVAQLEEAYQKNTQAAPQAYRGSQRGSPLPPPPTAAAGPAAGARLPPPQSAVPLQQSNGAPYAAGPGHANGGMHKPPLAPGVRNGPQQGLPPGRVTLAAAELQTQMGAAAAAQQGWPGQQHGALSHLLDPQAQLVAIQAEMSRLDGQNKNLTSTLQQKERELSALRQKAAAAAQPGAAAQAQRSAYAVGEMQRQLESFRQQLQFKEQEMDDLKRHVAEKAERLKQAEGAVTELRKQLRQQAAAAAAGEQPAASAAAPAPRSSGQKRRQSGNAPPSCGAAPAPEAAQAIVAPAAPAPAGAAPAGAAPAAAPPLLDPAVLAAFGSLRKAGWMNQLLAACSSSIAVLTGAASPSSADPAGAAAAGAAAAAAPTALLLRSQLAAAAQAPDADSLQFMAGFVRRMQQVACGALPPQSLLDSIASMVAASLAQLHSVPAGSSPLPPQRVQLIAAGLHVVQRVVALDSSSREAVVGASSNSSSGSLGSGAGGLRLSSRVTLGGPAAAVAAAAAAAAAPAQPGWLVLPTSSPAAAALPATELVVQQHPAVFPAPASGSDGHAMVLLPVVLTAALWLGPQHEAVAAGALGCTLEIARALATASRAGLAPVFTSGAMELFMQPAALRLPALQLLQLLLEDAALAQLFEGSLAQAAAIRGEPGPPTATAGTSGTGEGGGGSTPAQDAAPALSGSGGAGNGMAPMQADGGEAEGPWIGAAAIAERLLDSYVLDEALPGDGSPPRGSGAAAGSAAAVGAPGSSSSSSSGSSRDGTTVARAALQLVAALRESRQRGILVSLLLDDACGAPGCMLAQRLVQLAEAALAQPGEEAALMLLCPQQCPQGGGGSGGDGTMLLHRQAAWQARLRVAQEALTLLRGLLVDDSCGVAAMDDLMTIPAAARLTLTTLSRLSRLEVPRPPGAGAAPAPQPLLLALWARAIGSSTDQPSIGDAASTSGGAAAAAEAASGLPTCSVDDVVYLSRSLRRRVLSRMAQTAMAS